MAAAAARTDTPVHPAFLRALLAKFIDFGTLRSEIDMPVERAATPIQVDATANRFGRVAPWWNYPIEAPLICCWCMSPVLMLWMAPREL